MSKVEGSFEGQSFPAIFAHGESITIPDAHLLFCGDYSRQGHDLLLSGSHGDSLLVVDYFSQPRLADLISPEGATLKASVVNALAGPMNPGEYAQTGDQAGAASIGKVVNLEGTATVQHADGTTSDLKIGDPLAINDVLQTADGSNLGISFTDGTVFTLSGGSRMVLDNLVYQPGGSDNSMTLNVVQGTFAFVAGQVAPTGEMKIETPTATLGVRGTAGIIQINSDTGNVEFRLIKNPGTDHVGVYELKDKDGNVLAILDTDKNTITITPDGSVSTEPADATDPSAIQIINQLIKSYNAASGSDIPEIEPDKKGDNDGTNDPGSDFASSETVNDVLAQIVGGIEQALGSLTGDVLSQLNEAEAPEGATMGETPPPVVLALPETPNVTPPVVVVVQPVVVTLDAITGDNVINAAEAAETIIVTGSVLGNVPANALVTLLVNGHTYSGPVNGSTFSIAVAGADLAADPTVEVSINAGTTLITPVHSVDTSAPTAPDVALANDSGTSSSDGVTNVGAITPSNLEAGATVQYSTDGGETWSSTFTPVEGVNTVEVRQVDAAGNASSANSLTFTLDTTATATIAIDAITGDNIISAGEGAQSIVITGTVGGDVHDGDTVTLTVNGVPFTGTVSEGGFSIPVPGSALLGDGDLTVDATVSTNDQAGNFASASDAQAYTLSSAPPPAPGVALANDTGASPTDGITNNGTLALTGIEDGAIVEYSTDGGGTWSQTFTPVEGANNIQVRQTDAAGNSSDPTNFTFTLDTTPPAASITLDPVTADNVVSGSESGGSVAITGTVSGDVPNGTSVTVTVDGVDYFGSVVAGAFSVAVPGSALVNDGDHTVTAALTVTDAAGNAASASDDQAYGVDATPPNAGTLGFADLADTGSSSSDGVTQDNSFSLSLTGNEAGTVVYEVSVNGGETWTTTNASQSGLADGTYQFRATTTDAAGNSATTAPIAVTIDTTPPAAGTLSFSNLTDTGISGTDHVTQDNSFNLSVAGNGTGTIAYQVSTDGGETWNPTGAAQTGLEDGMYLYRATVTDAAGNSATTDPIDVTIDTTPPAAPNVTGFADDTGDTGDGVTSDTTLTLSGWTGSSDTARVEVFDGDTSLGFATINPDTSWTFDTSDLAEGEHSFSVRASDAAGNASETSEALSVNVVSDGINVIEGDDGPNPLEGTPGVDHIYGFGGADQITGHESDDILEGGAGADTYYWSEGDGYDTVIGDNASEDAIQFQGTFYDFDFSLDGNDLVFGVVDETGAWAGGNITIQDFADGGDTISYAEADLGAANYYNSPDREGEVSRVYLSAVTGVSGAVQGSDLEFIFGSTGNDTMTDGGGTGRTRMEGGDGNDTMTASGESQMVMVGGNGDDTIIGGGLDDNLRGSAGSDIIRGNPENYEGPADHDVVRYDRKGGSEAFTHGVFVNLSNDDATEMEFRTGAETTVSVNVASGQALDNWWTEGTPENNVDTIYDVEEVWGSQFDDVLIGNNHVLAGFAGNDLLIGTGNFDTVNYFGFFADQPADHGAFINMSDEAVTYNFYHDGVTTEETVQAGQALDNWWTSYDPGNNVDTLQGIENVWGSQYDDVIIGNADSNYIDAGHGDDIIRSGAGYDFLLGGDGHDTFIFGSDNEDATIADFTIGLDEIHFTDGVSITDAQLYDGEDLDNDPDGTWLSLSNDSSVMLLGVTALVAGNYYGESLEGSGANELLFGGGDSDTLTGNQGDDILVGGEGGDTYVWNADDGYDTIIGDNDGASQDIIQINGSFYDYNFEIDGQDLIVGVTADDSYDWNTVGGNLRIQDFFAPGGDSIDYLEADLGQNNQFYSPGGGDARIYFSAGTGTNQGEHFELILGTNGDDVLTDVTGSGEGQNRFIGYDGDDTITAAAWTVATLIGGRGNDTLQGAELNDQLRGGSGNDDMDGGYGVDVVVYSRNAASGNFSHGVVVNLSANPDEFIYFVSDDGENFYVPGAGEQDEDLKVGPGQAIGNWENLDTWASDPDGRIDTDTLNNIEDVQGSRYGDVIFGSDADNQLIGNGGDDWLFGGAGDDDNLAGGAGNDKIDGGDGLFDSVDYYEAQAGVWVDLSSANAEAQALGFTGMAYDDGDGGQDFLVNVEEILGSQHDDTLIGDSNNNIIQGRGGDDNIDGGGNDEFDGDSVDYYESPNGVQVYLESALAAPGYTGIAYDGYGNTDNLVNIENVLGSFNSDQIIGDTNNNYIEGRDGDDVLFGMGGFDDISGGEGADTFGFGSATGQTTIQDFVVGEDEIHLVGNGLHIVAVDAEYDSDEDTYADSTLLSLDSGQTILLRWVGNTVVGTGDSEFVSGSLGNEILFGGDGADTLFGDEGDDILIGGAGVDVYQWSAYSGYDTIIGENNGNYEFAEQDVIQIVGGISDTTFYDYNFQVDGNDLIVGVTADDSYDWNSVGGNLRIQDFFNLGGDTIDYLTADLGDNNQFYSPNGGDARIYLSAVNGTNQGEYYELILGTNQNDVMGDQEGSGQGINRFLGFGGDDTMTAASGTIAYLLGGDGNDTMQGADQDDQLRGGNGNDTMDGGGGVDLANYGRPATSGDFFHGVFVNLSGEEATYYFHGEDSIGVDFGEDFTVGAGQAIGNWENLPGWTLLPGDRSDTDSLLNIENVLGSKFDDVLVGNGLANDLNGAGGADILEGGAGSDILDGGADDATDIFVYRDDGDSEQQDQVYNFVVGMDYLRDADGIIADGVLSEIDTNDDEMNDSTLVTLSTGAEIVLHDVTGVSDVSELIEQNNFRMMSFMASDPTGDPAAETTAPAEDDEPASLQDSVLGAFWKRAEQSMNPNELALFQAVAAAAGLSIAQTQLVSSAHAHDAPLDAAHFQPKAHAAPFATGDGFSHYGLPSNLEHLVSNEWKASPPDHERPHGGTRFDGGNLHLRSAGDETKPVDHRDSNASPDTQHREDSSSSRTAHHEARHFSQDASEAHKQASHEEFKQGADGVDGPDAADSGDDAVPLQGVDLSGLGPLVDLSALPALGLFEKAPLHHVALHDGAALPNLGNVLDFSRDLFSDTPSPHLAAPSNGAKADGFAVGAHSAHVEMNAPVDFLHHLAADMEAVAHHPG